VNVTIEDLGSCKKLLRFEVDAAAVEAAFKETEKGFQREAAMPGFRPGKAPVEMVLRKYEKDIAEETKKRLISEQYRAAVKEQKVDVVNLIDVEEVQFARGQVMQFIATVETAPQFELPEYRGLPARREAAVVSDEDIGRALDALREKRAKFNKVERPLHEGDFAVVNYTGTCEGRPLTEFAAAARGLTEQKNFWVEIKAGSFIPGFTEQLVGAAAGDRRTLQVDFPADFVTPQVAGKKGVYEVEIVEVKERVLPELDDAFAKSYDAESMEVLREGVRADLQNELNLRQKRSIQNQLVRGLLDKVQFDLPESFVQGETRSVVYDIVSENQRRGIARDVLEKNKEDIYAAANQSAKERVKMGFLFQRIAEKEGIRVMPEELNTRISMLARMNETPPDKYLKELEKREAVGGIVQQLLHERVIAFLQERAKIEDVAPSSAPVFSPASPASASEPASPPAS
jgi:trigger factor